MWQKCFHNLNELCRFLDLPTGDFFATFHLYSTAFVVRLQAFLMGILWKFVHYLLYFFSLKAHQICYCQPIFRQTVTSHQKILS